MNLYAEIRSVAAKSFGRRVDVLEVRPTASADEFVVLSRFRDTPDYRAYFTHKYSTTAKSMYYGHYDMTLEQAVKSLTERA